MDLKILTYTLFKKIQLNIVKKSVMRLIVYISAIVHICTSKSVPIGPRFDHTFRRQLQLYWIYCYTQHAKTD